MLTVEHTTTYRYRRPVAFGPHRLMLRPREGHDLRLLAAELDVSPPAEARQVFDVLGNSVTVASFSEPASELRIASRLTVERRGPRPPRGEVEAGAARYPFAYPARDRLDLGRMLDPHYPDPADRVGAWARGFVLGGGGTDTLALLGDLSAGIGARFAYLEREEEGTQSPAETLGRGSGSCRDFAVLLAEAARALDVGARAASGYLHAPGAGAGGGAPRGAGATHAWAEVFLPGPGWVAFDPTNGTAGGADLVRVAVGRDIHQVVPVSGSFVGAPDDYLGMAVAVAVRPAPPAG